MPFSTVALESILTPPSKWDASFYGIFKKNLLLSYSSLFVNITAFYYGNFRKLLLHLGPLLPTALSYKKCTFSTIYRFF
jgi:hypothetical protein